MQCKDNEYTSERRANSGPVRFCGISICNKLLIIIYADYNLFAGNRIIQQKVFLKILLMIFFLKNWGNAPRFEYKLKK